MSEEKLEIRSALDATTHEPVYGNCTLVYGDEKVVFEHGRGVAPRSLCENVLVNNGGIEIPALGVFRSSTGGATGAVVQSQESVTAEGPPQQQGDVLAAMTPEQRIEAQQRLAELIAEDQGVDPAVVDGRTGAAAEAQPGPDTTVDEAARQGQDPLNPDEAPAGESEHDRSLRLAREHLAAEGEEVPDVEKAEAAANPAQQQARVVPAGFEDTTADGQLRCLATTAAQTQCQNAAKDGGPACQMDPHQKQFAA